MFKHFHQLSELKSKCSGYWAERILSQLEYALRLSEINTGKFDDTIRETVLFLYERYQAEGVITKASAQHAESLVQELEGIAKSYKIICAAHAHIDMNWMWGYAETVAVTLDTFRTMLNLMREYPDFTFSQSQASVYRIVEEYDPAMLEEIKSRIKEGRWEVTASAWVETDKNMPNGESLARHILYSKKYLSKLLGISQDSLNIDFEPDTFGHNCNVPEILSSGGVNYYYHCRGYEGHTIYQWEAPSGSSVIVYREPIWYNASIDSGIALYVPEFCAKHGIDSILKVYGVGDHGGGPTRKDIEKLIEMTHWPVFPTIKFGTFSEYFNLLGKIADSLPVVNKELNSIFTGCYTSQSRIKTANRISEVKLYEAEIFRALSANFAEGTYAAPQLQKTWEKVLFNQFHDILPGSGIIDTREYAMGQFQQVLAEANININQALRNIAGKINTSALINDEECMSETSEGAGVGYTVCDYGVPQTDRGSGKNRIIHFFNPSSHARTENVEVSIWDWPGELSKIQIRSADGALVKHQVIGERFKPYQQTYEYWSHKYTKMLINVHVPANGYSTYMLEEQQVFGTSTLNYPAEPRVERTEKFVLENAYMKVLFDQRDMTILSCFDKISGREMINPSKPAAIFRLIEEDDSKGMTAWYTGRYINIINLNQNVRIHHTNINKDHQRQWINYSIGFNNSSVNVTITLDRESPSLNYSVECDWREIAVKGHHIPQLNFHLPFAYKCSSYRYDVPFGTIVREDMDTDVPANSWAMGEPDENQGTAIMVVIDSKYGFRGHDNSISIALLRSSYDPDPYPEVGIHRFKFAVNIVNTLENDILIRKAFDYNHPITAISGYKHEGMLPPTQSFMALENGTAVISAVKMPEESETGSKSLIIRLYEVSGLKTQAVLRFQHPVMRAWYTDINENNRNAGLCIGTDETMINVAVEANSIATVYVEFKTPLYQ